MSDSLLTGKRCFVLDDEFLIALDIQQILERVGAADVASVASAAEAIALLCREPKFDVAVLDVKLGDPERNSLDVAALLQTQGTPFVFLTGVRVDDVHAKIFSPTMRLVCCAPCSTHSYKTRLASWSGDTTPSACATAGYSWFL